MAGCLDLIRQRPSDSERVRRWAEAGLQAAAARGETDGTVAGLPPSGSRQSLSTIVSELVSGIQDLLVRTLGPMIRITLALHLDRVPVLSDPTQLEMAVLNLAINARDAMPEGGNLAIATRVQRITNDRELEPDEYVELSVSDTGTGMSAEVAARAFDPFYTTKGIGKGTGLELSQVYGISRQAGGTARIEKRARARHNDTAAAAEDGHLDRDGRPLRGGRKRDDGTIGDGAGH